MTEPGQETPARRFGRQYWPSATDEEWQDWRWQLRNRVRDEAGVSRLIELSDDEQEGIRARDGMLPLGITPYYASLLSAEDPSQGLRRTKIPSMKEFEVGPDERADPLGEDAHSPVPGLVHTYPDKVLFLVTDFCATYCRYCTRARMVGGGEFLPERGMWETALAYIRERPAIRDVLLSGGDPLILSDERLGWLLERLAAIPHVEFLRIGTKVPVVLPMRITPAFCEMIRRFHPVFMSIHAIHPDELTPEVEGAMNRLADAGVVMGGQTVLLKGVNDDPKTMKDLNLGLLRLRCRPYYLHQCDPVLGSMHFRTPVRRGLEILESLHGHTTGYAVPMYMIDAPGGGGKIPIAPQYVVGGSEGNIVLRNFRGDHFQYHDPDFAGDFPDVTS